MQTKRSKYDTNPLDEKVAERAERSWGSPNPGSPTEEVRGGKTHAIGRQDDNEAVHAYSESEAPTRLIDGNLAAPYRSVFVPPASRQSATYQPPRVPPTGIYQPPPVPPQNLYQPPGTPIARRLSHNVAGLNIPEKWANLLPYVPGHIGALAAVIELILVPRNETHARFHAAQGLALQLAILILTAAFSVLTLISGSSFGSGIFRAASTIFLIISMIRVWHGKPLRIAPLDEATKWLDEKINPRK